jgi:hypothetical protein
MPDKVDQEIQDTIVEYVSVVSDIFTQAKERNGEVE